MAKERKRQTSSEWFVLVQELILWGLISGITMAVVTVSRSFTELGGVERQSVTSWSLLASVAVATMLLLWLIRSKTGARIFSGLFALAVLSGLFTAVSTLAGLGVAVLAVAFAILLYYNNPRVLAFDLILAIGLAGISASIGFGFRPVAVLVVLVCLSLYDIAAVYLTGHMVRIGKALLRRKAFFAMILPESPSGLLARISALGPDKGFSFLGTGDMVLPALLVSSVTVTAGILPALVVAVGAAVGLAVTHAIFISQKVRKPMAALPPIAAGAMLGYAFSVLMA